jgi:hypothetical protein
MAGLASRKARRPLTICSQLSWPSFSSQAWAGVERAARSQSSRPARERSSKTFRKAIRFSEGSHCRTAFWKAWTVVPPHWKRCEIG